MYAANEGNTALSAIDFLPSLGCKYIALSARAKFTPHSAIDTTCAYVVPRLHVVTVACTLYAYLRSEIAVRVGRRGAPVAWFGPAV
eukprot:638646-Prymnesium_polylepis.1